jgi:2',3'-cyclic-nucleotide 2'-phosphodiesterase (5'-nucleotidase family)
MVTILHTNDLHNCLGMVPRLAALMARERERDPAALLLNAGDAALGGRDADLGVQLLASLGYDAMVTGNSENDVLEHRVNLSRVGAPVVVANIAPGALGFLAVPYLIREVGGVRLAILGLTTPPPYPRGHRLHRPNAQEIPVHDAVEAARHRVTELRDRADLVVALSHMGLRDDLQLALQIPDIDLIIGGHGHHRLPSLLRIGSTYIAQAGAGGAYLGVLSAEAKRDTFQLSGRLEPVWQDLADDEQMVQFILVHLRDRRPEALHVVGSSSNGCWADPWLENPWANFVTDSVRQQVSADICFFKAMSLIRALSHGAVTRWDLGRCMPGSQANEALGMSEIVRMQLTGEAIHGICEHSVADLPWDLHEQVSSRHCLPGNGLLQGSGLRVAFDLARPEGERVTCLSVNGNAVDRHRTYAVVTTGFLAKGYSGYHWFRDGAGREVMGSERSIVAGSLGEGRALPDVDGRLRFKDC